MSIKGILRKAQVLLRERSTFKGFLLNLCFLINSFKCKIAFKCVKMFSFISPTAFSVIPVKTQEKFNLFLIKKKNLEKILRHQNFIFKTLQIFSTYSRTKIEI